MFKVKHKNWGEIRFIFLYSFKCYVTSHYTKMGKLLYSCIFFKLIASKFVKNINPLEKNTKFQAVGHQHDRRQNFEDLR